MGCNNIEIRKSESVAKSQFLCGSSLSKQVVENSQKLGKKLNNILFKGKIDLKSLEYSLKQRNRKFNTIIYLARNDLIPTRLHKLDNKIHVCLAKFCENECYIAYSGLLEILSKYAKQVIFIEPPPRASYINIHAPCSFYDHTTAQRFRNIVNSLHSNINVGVFTNITLLGFLKETNSRICAFNNTHFSKEALKITQDQVIEKYI